MIETLWDTFVILVLVDLLLSAVRFSVLNIRLPYLISLRDQYPRAVAQMMALVEKPRLRTSLRIGEMVVQFMLLGVSAWLFIRLAGGPPAIGAALLLLTLAALLLLLMELLLEGAILPKAELWAIRFCGLAQAIDFLLSPLSSLYVLLLGSPAMLEHRLSPVTEDELKSWAEDAQPEGTLEQGERQMIYSIFHFGDTLAREIMIPRIDIFALETGTSVEEAITALEQLGAFARAGI